MKKTAIIMCLCAGLALNACKGKNHSTGDSTGNSNPSDTPGKLIGTHAPNPGVDSGARSGGTSGGVDSSKGTGGIADTPGHHR